MFAEPRYVKQGKTLFGCTFVVGRVPVAEAKLHARARSSKCVRHEFRWEIIAAFAVGKRLWKKSL